MRRTKLTALTLVILAGCEGLAPEVDLSEAHSQTRPLTVPQFCPVYPVCAPHPQFSWLPDLNNCSFRQVCSCQTLFVCDSLTPPTNCALREVCPPAIESTWNATQKLDLSYCISRDFSGSERSRIIDAMGHARRAWERAANVRFIHRDDLDGGNCTGTTSQVLFDIRPEMDTSVNFSAQAFYPIDPRPARNVKIRIDYVRDQDTNGDGMNDLFFDSSTWLKLRLASVLTHEMGHVLGFMHEHPRFDQSGKGTTCTEDAIFRHRDLTSADPISIMQYSSCGGGSSLSGQVVTPRDAQGARMIYGDAHRISEIALRTSDGCFLGAKDQGGQGMVASATLGADQTFELIELGGGQVALRARHGHFVSAENDGVTLNANRHYLQSWETFTLTQVLGGTVAFFGTAHGKRIVGSCGGVGQGNGTLQSYLTIVPLDARPVALRQSDGRHLSVPRNGDLVGIGPRIFRDEVLYRVDLGSNKLALRTADGRFGQVSSSWFYRFDTTTLDPATALTQVTYSGWQQLAFRTSDGRNLTWTSSGTLAPGYAAPTVFTQLELKGEPVVLRTADSRFIWQALSGGGYDVQAVSARPVGGWETFRRVWLTPTTMALRADNGQYVTVGVGRVLFANVDWIDAQNTFTPSAQNGATCFTWFGIYVAAEGGGGRELVANRGGCYAWESFQVQAL